MSDQIIENFWVSIVAGVVVLFVPHLVNWLCGRLTRGRPTDRINNLTAAGATWLALNAAYIWFWPKYAAVFVFLSSAMMALVARTELNQFWRIGLVGADAHISSGVDFSRALRMATSSLDFLGIGASKLTGETTEFEAALQRCQRSDRPVRLLLCRPDDNKLLHMAQSASQDQGAYQKRVVNSLRVIADLRNLRTWNIQVRFYQDFPTFRLMFLNDEICLASHYVLGKGIDSELPQLHVVKRPASRDIDSLYYAFNSYFERFWADATPWDFKEHLDK